MEIRKPQKSQETTSDQTPFNKDVGDLQMQEEKTTKDFCDKIQLFLQKGVGFSQAGKGDRQTTDGRYSSNHSH